MFHAPTSKNKQSGDSTRARPAPERNNEVHPHPYAALGPVGKRAAILQHSLGNQAVLRMLDQQAKSLKGSEPGWHKANTVAARPNSSPAQARLSTPPGILQAKLVVGPANDPLEQEADRVANQVMRMPDPEFAVTSADPLISRKCTACEAEEKRKLQMKLGGTPDAAGHEAPAIVHEVLRSPGQPLDPATRAFSEPRSGYNFSQIRVHTDEEAVASTRGCAVLAATPQISPDIITASPVLQAQPTDAGQIDNKWYGLITANFGGPLGLAYYEPDKMRIFSPSFDAIGTVVTDASVPTADYELGFMQALIASNFTAVYVGSDGLPSLTYQITLSKLPVRDAADDRSKPWYSQKDVKSLDDGYKVSTDDQPRNTVPWQTPDRQGRLNSSSGGDYFSTWLVARQKSTGTLKFLNWITWSVDWRCSFDFATRTGTKTGAGGQVTGQGDGQGPFTPLTDDPIANDVITTTWGGPP